MYSKKKLWLLFLLLISSIILSPILSILTEINYGGTSDDLKEYIEFKNIDNQLIMRFNAKYYTTPIYNLLFSNIATNEPFLYFTGYKLITW